MIFGISFSFKERSNLCTIKPTSVESVGKFCMTKLSLNSVPQAVVGHCASWMTIGSAPGDQQPQGRSSPGGLILVRMRRVWTIITCFYMLYRLTLWMRPRSELFRESNSLRSSLGSIVHNSRWHALQWHNGRDVVSNHRRLVCLLNHLFSRRKKIKAPHHWPLWGESSQKANNAENVSIWWRHHGNAVRSGDICNPCCVRPVISRAN